MGIILNERACAEQALETLSLGNKPVETLGRLAKYYYSEGYRKEQIGGLLEDFMLKCDPTISIVKWQDAIDRQVSNADKYPLIDIKGIDITQSEIERIKALDGKIRQKLMFTMLCLAKYGNILHPANNNWVNKKDKEVFSLANITITTRRQSLYINDLWSAGYVGFSKVVDNINLNVRIVDNSSETALTITDFRNLGNQYLRFAGEKYFECQCCGLVVKKKSDKQKYCTACAVEVDRQKALERYRKRRDA